MYYSLGLHSYSEENLDEIQENENEIETLREERRSSGSPIRVLPVTPRVRCLASCRSIAGHKRFQLQHLFRVASIYHVARHAAAHASVREAEHPDSNRRAARELGLQPRILDCLVLGRSLVYE